MNAKKTIKKIMALGAGVTMVGATILGASAYNLADYPTPYIADGVFSGKIVVGERAATQDVLGAIDIAASLQASSTTVQPIEIPGLRGGVTLEGDAFKVETSSDLLELREPVGDVFDTLTYTELEALQGGQIVTDEGSTDYNQYLRLGDSTNGLQSFGVNYIENDDNVLGDYLVIDDTAAFFQWELEFTEGLESSSDNSELADLEDEVINIFGTDFTIVDTAVTVTGGVTLTLMAGDVSSTMREGETKTFTIDGVDYEVSLIFVSDPNTGSAEAKFMVNGEVTDSLEDGDTDTLSGGVQIGVRDLLVNSREGVVEFFLGANKIEMTDSTTSSESFNGDVEINNQNIGESELAIIAGNVSTTKFEITNIKYNLTADAADGSTIYIPPGHGVREYLDEPEGLLSPTFDIRYEGLNTVTTNNIEVQAQSDHSYDMMATNIRSKTYEWPLATNQGGVFIWGEEDDDFWFTEPTVVTTGGTVVQNLTSGDFWVSNDDYFLLSEGTSVTNSEKDDSAVLQYDDIDTDDRVLEFTDMSTGQTRQVSYLVDASNTAVLGVASNFVVEGNSYTVWIGNSTGNPLAIDLNGDGDLSGDRVTFTARGGGILDFSTDKEQTLNSTRAKIGSGATSQSFDMQLATASNQFDDGNAGDSLNWTITSITGEEIDLSVSQSDYAGPLASSGGDEFDDFILTSDESNDDYERGMTDYGALLEVYNPSGSSEANELTIEYPDVQRGAQVFVTAGSVSSSSTGGGATREVVNQIAVGLAVLDVDAPAVGSENLIVVGGPCANNVAFELMGRPTTCGAGFSAGKALIKSWDNNGHVSVLVAGYEAQETLGASYVLANYADYSPELSGSEVEVVVPNLSNLKVQSISMTVEEEVAENSEDIAELEDEMENMTE